jgi:hypothetical protein
LVKIRDCTGALFAWPPMSFEIDLPTFCCQPIWREGIAPTGGAS